MDDQQLIDRVTVVLLQRRGITWTPEAEFLSYIHQAAQSAIGLLRSHAGNEVLPLETGEDFDLAVTCAWYLAENRRAEFLTEYAPELRWLRLREAVDEFNREAEANGTTEDTGVS